MNSSGFCITADCLGLTAGLKVQGFEVFGCATCGSRGIGDGDGPQVESLMRFWGLRSSQGLGYDCC